VGQYKSGTTALYEMLRAHPQVFMPDLKEIWFHSPELRTRAIGRASNRRPETLEQYLSLFAAATPQQRIGEATPSYLISHEAARSIAELRPDARIVAILRDPATFLQSFHLQAVQNRIETEKDLRKALALEPARREGKSIPPYAARPLELLYSDHVRYVEQLRRYDAVFGREQMLVLIYEDFRRDNEATMRTLLRFIGVDESQPIPSVEANPTVRVRSPRLHRMLWSVYLGRGRAGSAVQRVVKPLVPKRLRGKALKATQTHLIYGSPRSADAELMVELRRRFKGEVQALSDYLDRDLITLWGYDELG
jgi:hypothetical protein